MNTSNTRYGKDEIERMLRGKKNLFFVGIGGINMSSLAAISNARGFCVSGSDRAVSPETDGLEARGIRVFHEHKAENIDGADALIYTVSIPVDNPEYVRAGELSLPRISRADFLGWLMNGSEYKIGVSGMHGKSTVTCMCSSILLAADVDATISSGAVVRELGCTYRTGGDKYFLFESCEYKDSFLSFYPSHAAILNIEMDHPDYFADIAQVKDSFSRYLDLVSDTAVVNWSDANVREVSCGKKCRLLRFGTSADEDLRPLSEYDFYADRISMDKNGSKFTLHIRGGSDLQIKIAEAGIHNVRDAVAAAALSLSAGIGRDAIASGLRSFRGAARRMELIGKTSAGAEVYLDYAHHPTEIEMTLKAARLLGGRLYVIFQPHTYTRTKSLFDDFARALSAADEVVLADIYAAREADVYGVDSRMLADAVRALGGSAVYSGDIDCNGCINGDGGGNNCAGRNGDADGGELSRIARYVLPRVGAGDVVFVMGAGSIVREAPYLINR